MRVLGLDTATPATAVAVLETEGGRHSWQSRRHVPAPGERPGHSARLLPLVEELVAEAGGWPIVDLVAVGVGPGGFTGLRIGVATARALAQARDLPLAGVSTLASLAAAAAEDPEYAPQVVMALLDARRGEVFAAGWERGEPFLAPAALAPAALGAHLSARPGGALAVGDGAIRFRPVFEAADAVIPEDASPLHLVDAGRHCLLALRAPASDPATVLPDYVRPPDAEPRPRS